MDVPIARAHCHRFRANTPEERDRPKHDLVMILDNTTDTVSILLLLDDDRDAYFPGRVIYRWFKATTQAERVWLKREVSENIDQATEPVSAIVDVPGSGAHQARVLIGLRAP